MTSSKRDGNYVTVRELMDLAVDFEKDSAEFYRDLQDETEDDNVREVLSLLERQEWGHRKLLRNYEIKTNPHNVLQFAPSFSLAMPAAPSRTMTLRELLDLALQRETKARQIYQNSASMVSEDLKDLLQGLATFEREHEEKIKSLTSYLISGEDS